MITQSQVLHKINEMNEVTEDLRVRKHKKIYRNRLMILSSCQRSLLVDYVIRVERTPDNSECEYLLSAVLLFSNRAAFLFSLTHIL